MQPGKALFDQLRGLERVVDRASNSDGDVTQPSGSLLVGKEVVRKDGVEVQDRVATEADLPGVADKEFHRILVIENHLGFEPVSTFRLLAELDQPLRVEQ